MVPRPVGWTTPSTLPDVLIPFFSSSSESFSRWIPLGLARVNPDGSTNQVEFFFEGTDAEGSIIRSGTSAQEVTPLRDFADGTISVGGAAPSIDTMIATLSIPADQLDDPNLLYGRNPLLLREFVVRFRNSSNPLDARDFDVATAAFNEDNDTFEIALDARGDALSQAVSAFTAGAGNLEAEIVPFFFRVVTAGVEDLFPALTDITISFDATVEDPLTGQPSSSPDAAYSDRIAVGAVTADMRNGFATDISALNGQVAEQGQTDPTMLVLETPVWDFVRFRVEFNIDADTDPTTTPGANSPRPGLDFLRIPYRF